MIKTKVKGINVKKIKGQKLAQLCRASSILLLLILLLSTLSTPICNAEEENEGNIGILIIAQQPYSGD